MRWKRYPVGLDRRSPARLRDWRSRRPRPPGHRGHVMGRRLAPLGWELPRARTETRQSPRRPRGCERADQDVRVQENPHETSRATSSSVRYPRASANGSVLRRSRSNLRRLNCRRRASRTSSLRVRPVCLQSRPRSFSRSGSSRIVTADLMSFNVLRMADQRIGPSNYALNPVQGLSMTLMARSSFLSKIA